jgi:indolepyruvate ferredoxin oxidoreductase beta subunit
MVAAGLARVVDFQDVAYGTEYLDLVEPFAALEASGGQADHPPDPRGGQADRARHGLRRRDPRRRPQDARRRVERVRTEVAAGRDQIVQTTEFMHPGMEEVCGTLPAAVGQWIEARPRLFAALPAAREQGRRVNTATLRWFLPLYVLAGMRRFRRTTLRHRREQASSRCMARAARACGAARHPRSPSKCSRPGGWSRATRIPGPRRRRDSRS